MERCGNQRDEKDGVVADVQSVGTTLFHKSNNFIDKSELPVFLKCFLNIIELVYMDIVGEPHRRAHGCRLEAAQVPEDKAADDQTGQEEMSVGRQGM